MPSLLDVRIPIARIIEDNSLKDVRATPEFHIPRFHVDITNTPHTEAFMARIGRRLNSDRTVTVSKEKLLAKLRANLEQHNRIHQEAMQGYIVAVKKYYETVGQRCSDHLSNIADGQGAPYVLDPQALIKGAPQRPVSAAKAYQEAIDTFEWDEVSSIELTRDEFNAYIRNEWEWMRDLLHTNSQYSKSATRVLRAMALE